LSAEFKSDRSVLSPQHSVLYQKSPLTHPPSTTTVWPVMYDARSEARKATAAAISSGRAIRRIGTSAAHPSIISSLLFPSRAPRSTACSSCRAVRVQPGATLLIVTPSAATSFESDLAHPVRPARPVFDSSK